MMDKLRETITVILVQTKVGSHPHEAIPILAQVINHSARKTLGRDKGRRQQLAKARYENR
jgi:hypothetical protein